MHLGGGLFSSTGLENTFFGQPAYPSITNIFLSHEMFTFKDHHKGIEWSKFSTCHAWKVQNIKEISSREKKKIHRDKKPWSGFHG